MQGTPDLLGLVGRLLGGRYRVTRPLGAGGMGAVYEAMQEDLGRRVAIKVLLPHLTFQSELVARFRREAQAAAALGHPHIVQVTDFGGVGASAPFSGASEPTYLVMEYLDGQSLASLIAAQGALAPGRVARIGAQILSALEAAHRGGIIHRDIKPDNVFLVAGSALDDFVKLLDFGVAKLQGDTEVAGGNLTATGAMIGTLAYMAPEQAQGVAVDGRADLYAVGACMYHALTGRMPFQAPTAPALLHAILGQPLTPLASVRADVDPGLAAIVERALSKDPRARLSTADDMRRALAPWTSTLPSQAPFATLPQAGPSPVLVTPPGQHHPVDPRGATIGVSSPAAQVSTPPPKSPSLALWLGLGFGLLFAVGVVVTVVVVATRPKTDTGGVWVMNAPRAEQPVAAGPTTPTPSPGPTGQSAKSSSTGTSSTATATVQPTAPVQPVAPRDAGSSPGDAGAPSVPRFSDKPQGGTTVSVYVTGYGPYSGDHIRQRLAPSQGALDACYAASQFELTSDGTDHRLLYYHFNVTPAGKVTGFRVPDGITYHVVNLEACLRRVLSAVDLGPPLDPKAAHMEMVLQMKSP